MDGRSEIPEHETIMIYPHSIHFFVIYKFPGRRLKVADGSNMIRQKLVRKELEEYFGESVIAHRFLQQRQTDHCGSSAVAIALAIYRDRTADGNIPLVLQHPCKDLDTFRKALHTSKSVRIATEDRRGHYVRNKCPSCGKQLAKTGAHFHIRKCDLRGRRELTPPTAGC